MQYTCQYNSPIGDITLSSDGQYLTGIHFNGLKTISTHPAKTNYKPGTAILEETKRWLDIYFQGKNPDFTPKIKLEGTPFRIFVWEILTHIPYGHTRSYKDIAEIIVEEYHFKNMSAQAIGGTVSHNPIPIIIPCHRVIGASGKLIGYSAGLERKVKLLELEGIKTSM